MKIEGYGRGALWAAPAIKKLLRVMKITSFLLLVVCLQATAGGFGQNVTLDVKNTPIEKVFREIEKQSGYSFWHRSDVVSKKNSVNLSVKNMPLQRVLDILCSDQQLSYSIVDKIIVVKKNEIPVKQVKETAVEETFFRQFEGMVLSAENKQGLAGATVLVKGKRETSTTTDDAGYFSIEAEVGDILSISFVGFQPREMVLPTTAGLVKIELNPQVDQLESVTISTGYQTISRERSAGSFAKADKDVFAARSTSMNVLQRLDGLIPGLTVNNAPNASSNPLLIRGLTTINANRNPLIVVDGIPLDDISSINPQDVEDVTVLRDATAASIWGSRAANGVVIIVTKKGKTSEKLRVTYDGFVNMQGKPDLDYLPGLDSRQFIDAARQVFSPQFYPYANAMIYQNLASTGIAPHEGILYLQSQGRLTADQANKSLDSLAGINNMGQIKDLWYRNAVLQNHTLSLNGGGKAYSFYGSMSYTGNQSNRPGEENQTFKIMLRQDLTLNSRLNFFLITDLTNNRTSAQNNINIGNRFYPYQLFRDEQGNNLSMSYMQYLNDSLRDVFSARSRVSLDYNPLDEVGLGSTKADNMLSRITGGLSFKIINGLRFEGTYAYIRGTGQSRETLDQNSYPVRSELVQFTVAANPQTTPVYYLPTNGSRLTISDRLQRNYTIRNQLIYDKTFAKKHQLNLLAGQEAQEQFTNVNQNTLRGYNAQLLTVGAIDYATLFTTGVTNPVMPNNSGRSILAQSGNPYLETEQQVRFTSYYANLGYTYNGKYSLNGSWRIDQSNLFGLDKAAQNRSVWSTGVKWIASREEFMDNVKWLRHLALRATYGITGNAPTPGTAASEDILRSAASNFFPGGVGLLISTPANNKLSWESTETINLGIDFGFTNNRVNGGIDFYQKKTTDLIGTMGVNAFTGYNTIVGNFGDMTNRGIELSLTTLNIKKRNFIWSSTLIGAYNKNKITRLALATPIVTGIQKWQQNFMPGYTAFALFAYQFAGLDNLGDPLIYLADKTTTKAPNVAMADDVTYQGTYQPEWTGGFSNTFRYKNFSLVANAVFNMGHVMRRPVNTFYTGRLTHPSGVLFNGTFSGNIFHEFAQRWMKPGDELITSIPSYEPNQALSNSRRDVRHYTFGDINVVSASFIKFRDITLMYQLPATMVKRIKSDGITLRAQVSNVMLWRANKYGIDPEFIGNLPVNQNSITLGANVRF